MLYNRAEKEESGMGWVTSQLEYVLENDFLWTPAIS